MKKAFYFIAVLFIIGCAKEKKPAEGSVKGVAPAQSVQVVVVQQQALENSINATGTVLSNEEVEIRSEIQGRITGAVSYTHLRAHETVLDLVCRLLLEKKNTHTTHNTQHTTHTTHTQHTQEHPNNYSADTLRLR